MSNYTPDILDAIKNNPEIIKERKNGRIIIGDDYLDFPHDGFPNISKVVLDEGYEDKVTVIFASNLKPFKLDLGALGIGNPRIQSESAAEKIVDLIISILHKKYTLDLFKLAGTEAYRLKLNTSTYVSAVRPSLLPKSVICRLGSKQTIVNDL